ncbi:glycosyltransferase family 2 protein [Antarcticimicrobium luteum]|uniref:Glycosyltransferase family 2 protein n=1 Tax=Antarcticimicrobium luteum TaxID=2547397 RepID=A0A4R5VGC9_9RHOB|nr:glycosyltransferase family 2 protein [Antarcticimicrobium luteum]TDK52117.1 glycosyltransferase family 2 protein [Antarcticimicrobium luteum]
MKAPTVLTIILNYRTPDLTLKSAGAALRAMDGMPGEVLIVDNDSGDGSFARISAEAEARGWTAQGRLRVVDAGRNGGFGAGMNFGIRTGLSGGEAADFYYLLNSDAWPEPDAIRHLRDFLVTHPGAGLAGSFVEGEDGVPHRAAFRFPSIAGEFEMAARTGPVSRLLKSAIVAIPVPETETRVDWAAGASLMLRAEMLEQIGLFDETFFLYFEETDLCLRAARAGWDTYFLPQSKVIHLGSASTGMKDWPRTPSYWFESRRHYFAKNHGRPYAAAATLARVAGQAIWQMRRAVSGKPQADPDRFLRDLIFHDMRAGRQRPMRIPPFPVPHTVAKDKK